MTAQKKEEFAKLTTEITEAYQEKSIIDSRISSNMTEIIIGAVLTLWIFGLIILIPAMGKRQKLINSLNQTKQNIKALELKKEQLLLQ